MSTNDSSQEHARQVYETDQLIELDFTGLCKVVDDLASENPELLEELWPTVQSTEEDPEDVSYEDEDSLHEPLGPEQIPYRSEAGLSSLNAGLFHPAERNPEVSSRASCSLECSFL